MFPKPLKFNIFQLCMYAIIFGFVQLNGQHLNTLTATLDGANKDIFVQQQFVYVNDSNDSLPELYFNDWTQAYADKNSALAKRFADEFKKGLHLAKPYERGATNILSVIDDHYMAVSWKRTKQQDIILFSLNEPLAPKDSIKIFLTYRVKLPPNKFTPYGYDNKNRYYLKDWYLTPAVYDSGKWTLYSNKNLEDLHTGITNTEITFNYSKELFLTSNFNESKFSVSPFSKESILKGYLRKSSEIILTPTRTFTKHVTPTLTVVTDLEIPKYDPISKGVSINKVAQFITDNLGAYPHEQLLVSEIDNQKNPLYGLNQLPSFVRPYENQFQFEMEFLKTALNSFLRETLFFDIRKDRWVNDALVNYLMIKYVETYYEDQKLLGKLSSIWGLRSFHLAKMDFNEQYSFLHMLTARKNLDQSLVTANDSLIKFNQKIANRYKAGLGLAYLSEYIGEDQVAKSISQFYSDYKLKTVDPNDFMGILEQSTDKDIKWFKKEYVSSNKRIDYNISNVFKTNDSLAITLKNKGGTNVPISLFGLRKDSVVSRYWFSDIAESKTFTIPRQGEDRLVLNFDQKIPEFNQRDNWKTLNGFFSSNKKLKFQFFKDTEDPYYNQIFYVPVMGFNIYDGLTPGMRIHNKTLLERPFIFDFAPSYAIKEQALVGYGKFNLKKYYQDSNMFVANYSLSGSSFHFAENSRYTTITPSVSFGWRPDNLISNKREYLTFRYVNVMRTVDENQNLNTDPDYNVINARYINSNNGVIDYVSWFVDAQHSNNFSKVAFNLEYRKLFENNRQLNLRFFAGKFIRNKTNSDFFSFALDRPTDYLFDYNYLGRSEDSGIYSQQIIIAEGGFKSKLENPFSDDWIATTNASVNLWRWIELYGDIGFIKSKGFNERFVYDSGIRLNLVTDYFELYFPLYSNNGWEVSQPQYEEKIRFIVTLSPKTLLGLFNRKWF
ncbi:metalloprotease [Sediminicola sp. 1XM1-17]|uniref:metalloprotease n=1 Tax=Sediminicola sp. 1XM1-17 TaxID=3127702 RepID=UPI003077E7AA